MTVYPAIDVLKFSHFDTIKDRNIGLLTHIAACDSNFTPTYDLLANTPGFTLKTLFSPEHGLLATFPDGALVSHNTDKRTRLPVYSMYGDSKKADRAMFEGIDLMLIDLQDVGARFYTYTWTLALMLEACGEYGIDVLVLDRPNPLGGVTTTGLYVEENSTSFVGHYARSLPMTHGLTIGEIARFFNGECNPKPCKLTVLGLSGWRRSMLWPDTELPWIPASPAMPHFGTVAHYPGAALIEGTTLSEGRGTALPFEIVGAPEIDAFHLAERLNMQHLPGVRFRPHAFRPTAGKYARQDCQGVQAHITQLRYFNPVRVWLHTLIAIRALYPDIFGWIEPVNDHQHFDLLIGNTWAREMIDANARADDILSAEREMNAHFEERRTPYLMYG